MALDTTSPSTPDTAAAPSTPATPAPTSSPAPVAASVPEGSAAPVGAITPAGGDAAASAAADAADAAATAQAIAEIEALLDGQPMKLRADLLVPWKRGEESGHVPLQEAIDGYQRTADYTRKTQELAAARREFEAQTQQQRLELETFRRQVEAERTAVQREMQRHLSALTSGDETARERYERHLELLAGDEDYRRTYEKALKAEAYEAAQGVQQELSQQQYVQAVQADIAQAVDHFSQQFSLAPEQVDRVLARYELVVQQEGDRALTTGRLRALFQEEAQYAQTVSTPLKSELDALKAELERLKSGSQATAHNDRVRQTVQKATAARAAATPAAGGPAAPRTMPSTRPQAPLRSREDATRAWAKGA